ncbi:MAG TPA: cupin domain-containing protein [Acidimicrobiales bacterium]|nr:cupin domain-containing protein [Acidimicrobiales bacterium]
MSIPEQSLEPYVCAAENQQRLAWIGQIELTVILDAAATGGQLTVIQGTAGRGDASPVHVHSRDDEIFLLREGAMTVWVGDRRVQLAPGGVGFLPKGIAHAFRFDAPSEALIITTPSGQEEFFRAAGWDLSRPVPDGWAITPDALREAAAGHGTQVIGPPHGLDD